ncbi:MAG: ribose-phosphate diphosphokinase [Patescibacteria group bacterium]
MEEHRNLRPLALLAGSESEQFLLDIAKKLEVNPIIIERTIENFHNGEIGVEILTSVKGCEVYIVMAFAPGKINDGIIELLLLADAVARAGAERINVILRNYPYARQERREKNKRNRHKRRPISAKLMADLISLRFYGMIVFDLHAEAIEGFFDKVKVENIIPFKLFKDYLYSNGIVKKSYALDEVAPLLVAPDIGSVKKVSDYADNMKLNYAIVNKVRIDGTNTLVKNVIGDVSGRTCILIDDITATGSTIIKAKDALKEKGAIDIIGMVTHFEGVSETDIRGIMNAGFKKFIVTDSVPLPEMVLQNTDFFEVLPLAPLVAKVISNIYNAISLQPVFDDTK